MCKWIYIVIFSILFADTTNTNQEKFNWKLNLIPLAGQIKNKKYIKGGILGTLQAYSLYKFSYYNQDNQIAKRNTYVWWIFGLYFYSMIDAYVDYNLKNFPKINKKEKNEE